MIRRTLLLSLSVLAGCATPQYAIRPTPVPDESAASREIELAISAYQAQELEQQGMRPIGSSEVLRGFEVQRIVDQLSRVTERPSLRYRASLLHDDDPNAVALADGRIYVTTGMLNYLASRGARVDELASVLSHEIAHTVAQHLVKRYRMLQQQQLLMTLVAAGASVAARGAGSGAQQAGQFAGDLASLLADVAFSGYSQEQELEADQLGVRYMIRAGCDPQATLDLLQGFERFENPWPFLRTHPYMALRRAYLEQYLADIGHHPSPAASSAPIQPPVREERRHRLLEAQRLYPKGSLSWQNLQRQLDALEPPVSSK